MRVRYNGGIAAVEIRLPDGQWLTVKRGGTVEVPDEIGAGLIERSDWSEVKPVRKKPAAKKKQTSTQAQEAPEEQPDAETPAGVEKGAE